MSDKPKKYAATKTIRCPRCRLISKHKLVDYNYAIYKCEKCGNVHV